MRTCSEMLSYREPGHAITPGAGEVGRFCVVPLLSFGMTGAMVIGVLPPDVWIALLTISAVSSCDAAFRRYWRGPKPWYVITCLTLNGLGFALFATPLAVIWMWALLALYAR